MNSSTCPREVERGEQGTGHVWEQVGLLGRVLLLAADWTVGLMILPRDQRYKVACVASRKFTVHILLKPDLENFEHYFASMWNECNCVVV